MECAEGDMKSQPLVEEAGNFAIRPPFAAQFADQFTVRLQFGARRLFRERFEDNLVHRFHNALLPSTSLHCSNRRPISGSDDA
jgi:hypothetical protein